MKYKSQNNEVEIVLGYFKGFKGNLLDIGANDGKTFSNSYDLIKLGWNAVLVEPSIMFDNLSEMHKENNKVTCLNVAISEKNGVMKFYESGAHVKNGSDKALVSTLDIKETERWKKSGVEFVEKEAQCITASELPKINYDFITIDCEGYDFEVLSQINLKDVGCKCLCIEWNGDIKMLNLISKYVKQFGMKEISRNRENLIFAL